MYIHPTTGTALAEQHRRDLMSQASASRQARAARQSSSRNPSRRPLIVGALRTATAASAIAAAAFLAVPAGPAHVPSAHGLWGTHSSWGTSYQTADSHRAVLAVHYRVHYRTHRFVASHHFQTGHRFVAGHVSDDRWA
jgi:hypothetical protein